MLTLELELELIDLVKNLLDFLLYYILKTLIAYKHYSSYINSRLVSTINKTIIV
jgi:hypothetical protein